ncbi:hypothetical protein [Fibrobacter sp. UWP2]|uniref:hypothetical protein n=1 Tax=Fibrobacter sp. UWP2 TaxID=1896216 RepID=UPI00091AC68F|nr:hypothetical protein [Fibrobacter sp. UWP2]SHI73141.1 hypothetical protein SAMN05720471_10685 [Fibrobacter sp. UWP2]
MKSFAILPLLAAASVFAGPLTWDMLINSVKDDPVLQASEKRSTAASTGAPVKLWENVELRYKLDGFSFATHDFELRFKPKSFGSGSADKAYYESQKNYQNARLAVDRSLVLYERYERALRYTNRRKIAALNQQVYQVNQDRIEVLHLKAGASSFNTQDLISAIEREATLRAELMSDSAALRDAELKMKSWVSDFEGVELDSSFLPTMDELATSLEKGFEIDENAPLIMKAKSKMESERAKAKQDLAKNRDYISHIGIGYELKIESLMEKYKTLEPADVYGTGAYADYVDDFEKETGCDGVMGCTETANILVPDYDNRKTADKFFVNLAVKLPFFDSNNGSAIKNQVAELDAESDYLDAVRQVNQRVGRLSEEIVALVAQWKVQKEFVQKVNAGSIFEDFAQSAGSDPLLLLRARESALESDMKAVKLEADIFDRYLMLLDYAGVFANTSIHNHLREGLK